MSNELLFETIQKGESRADIWHAGIEDIFTVKFYIGGTHTHSVKTFSITEARFVADNFVGKTIAAS